VSASTADLFRALGVLAEAPGPEHARLAELLELPGTPIGEDYADIFLFQLYPYASAYVGGEGMLGGEARDRVAGAWRALGRTPPTEPDHLGALLGLYAALSEHASVEIAPPERILWDAARQGLLWEHILSWALPYLARVMETESPVYSAWARLLAQALRVEAARTGPPVTLPLHLRDAPALDDPRRGDSEAFLSGLLAPVRSGMILTRLDLARGARDMKLGLRLGERRFVLRSFFAQEADRTIDWLARQASAAARGHAAWECDTGPVEKFWTARALATTALLESLRETDVSELDIEVEQP
jgi:TorA maturation chaperone TorD